MPNDKDYGKIESEFQSIKMAPAPMPTSQPGSQHNPGVCPALNTPPTEGRVKTVWYYDPGSNTPSLEKSVSERINSHFDAQVQQQVIAYQWSPGDAGYARGSGAIDSPLENVLGIKVNDEGMRSVHAPTPPGDPINYGGGQAPGGGATPPGDPMQYGGGQG